MKKTILSKILFTNFIILISALLVAMLLMALLYGQVLLNQQKALLIDVADEIAALTDAKSLSYDDLQQNITRMGKLAHAKIYRVTLGPESIDSLLLSLDQDALSPFIQEDLKLILLGNEVYRSLQFSKFFSAYTVFLGRPLLKDNEVIGLILLFKPLSELPQGILVIGIIFISMIMGVLLVGFILIRWTTKRITFPIIQLSEAAHQMAVGQPIADLSIMDYDELGELTRVFNEMKNKIENHDQEKNAFMAMVSHDIKTPMMSINGYVEAILDEVIPEEELMPTLKRVHTEIQRLTRLTQELLRVSKSRDMSFMMRLETFDLIELIKSAIDSMKRYDKKDVLFEFDDSCKIMVKADRDKIMQVVSNVLSNAIKFSKEECSINILCQVKNAYLLYLAISDNGVGIPDDQLIKVFEPQVRLNRDIHGEGLGLAITKKLVEMHGGKINVESVYGESTTFVIELPIVMEEHL